MKYVALSRSTDIKYINIFDNWEVRLKFGGFVILYN
jgi:hypothetical protein